MNGGRFDFDDGGTYCGGWEDGKAHGHGVCTGPKGQGEYSGAWHYGFEVSGIYTWPSGNTYEGQWQNGKRHGLGVERRGRWLYRGEWTQGYKGRYGVRQSLNSQAKYEGTWSSGLQDGYGMETYADGGTYQGQWLRGMRHGYGIRKSAPYGVAAKYRTRSHAHASLTSLRSEQGEDGEKDRKNYAGDESRGGFVLRARSEPPTRRRSLSERSIAMRTKLFKGFHIKKQRSTGDIHQRVTSGTGSIRSSGSTASCTSDESAYTGHSGGPDPGLGPDEFVDPQATETYMGEWKNDKRSGFGVSERSDGLKYEGEWFNNRKFGYGVTTHKDGRKEEGKYKNNILVTSQRKRHLLFVRSSKLRERIDAAISAANRAAQIALQKADIGISRTATARDRAEQADYSSSQAKEDSDLARIHAKQFDPNFRQPGTETLKKQRQEHGNHVPYPTPPPVKPNHSAANDNPHFRTRSLFVPKNRGSSPPLEDSSETTPPMQTPPSEIRSAHYPTESVPSPVPGEPVKDMNFIAQQSPPVPDFLPNRDHSVPPNPPPPAPNPSVAPDSSRGARPSQVAFLEAEAGTSSSPSVSRTGSQTSSRFSLNQIMNDHFDQYTMAANPSAAKLYQANWIRQQQQIEQSQTEPQISDTGSDIVPSSILRRSTLASSRDWKDLPLAYQPTNPPVGGAPTGLTRRTWDKSRQEDLDEAKGSLPDLTSLDKTPVHMTREEVSRLSSQRRQEMQRMHEEAELLRNNPLRYLFHPAVRAWFLRWKLPLLVLLVNLCLSVMFYQLLTYQKPEDLDDNS